MQIHLIVVSIFLKTCVKDHGDSSSLLLERRVWLVCIEGLLLAEFNNLEYKRKVNLKNLKLFKNLSSGLKIIR